VSMFRVKGHREPRKPRTPAQDAATERSFRIFRLRGLYSQALLLTGARRAAMRDAIDGELQALGVETQAERERVQRETRARIEAREALDAEIEAELPF